MLTKDQIALRLGDAIDATPVPASVDVEPFAPWDSPDLLAAVCATPAVMRNAFGAETRDESKALFREGPRGPTARSAVTKQIAIERRLLRVAEALLGIELERYGRGRTSERRLRVIEAIADRAHRRYTSSYRLFLEMASAQAPTVRIRADRAAFAIDARSQS